MGLLERVAGARAGRARAERSFPIDTWLGDYLLPSTTFGFQGGLYQTGGGLLGQLYQTQAGTGGRVQEVSASLPGYAAALRRCPPAFAAQLVRALVISQARFTFRNRPSSATPRRTFGTTALTVLERPWTNATTGELLARMEWHAGLTGNAYVARQPGRLRVLRPDWVGIVFGSDQEPDDPAAAIDGEVLGYVYQQGGLSPGNQRKPQTLLPSDVAHWTPLPDPERAGLGMSWVTPAIRDIQGDGAATEHKLRFFAQGATPNMVVKGIPAATKQQFDDVVDRLEASHAGVRNAYRTLYLTAGADVSVVGSDLKQMDFKVTQGAGETRIAFLSRVPATILGIAEGLAGSSLNAGNFGMARRLWADSWIYPTLQDMARALAPLVRVPDDAELWFDTADMPILREDAKDAAEIEQVKAATIVALVSGGFTPESAIAAVVGQNMTLLKPIPGWLSVQLQPGGPGGAAVPALPARNGR